MEYIEKIIRSRIGGKVRIWLAVAGVLLLAVISLLPEAMRTVWLGLLLAAGYAMAAAVIWRKGTGREAIGREICKICKPVDCAERFLRTFEQEVQQADSVQLRSEVAPVVFFLTGSWLVFIARGNSVIAPRSAVVGVTAESAVDMPETALRVAFRDGTEFYGHCDEAETIAELFEKGKREYR